MEIRRSYDRLISTTGFPILVRWHLNIESGPRFSLTLMKYRSLLFTAASLAWELSHANSTGLQLKCSTTMPRVNIKTPSSSIGIPIKKMRRSWDDVIFMMRIPILVSRRLNTETGPMLWFNIKIASYQYLKSHCGYTKVVRSSYLNRVISYTGKMTLLYWIRLKREQRVYSLVRSADIILILQLNVKLNYVMI